jgi:predicted  nucleic acid-binding Zn-ribbon protein
MSLPLRSLASVLLLVGSAWSEELPAPQQVPAPVDLKAHIKELENKQKPIRDAALKDDAELAKLKAEADEAKKRYESGVEAKLSGNADYAALKVQIDELKAQRKKKEQEAKEAKEEKPKPKE